MIARFEYEQRQRENEEAVQWVEMYLNKMGEEWTIH